jgi:glycosyltransferase involved in cell wall biosynthesis
VIVVPLTSDIADVRKDSLGGATLLRVADIYRSFKFVWRLSRILSDQQIDIVHTNSLKADILGGIAARLAGLPLIWHIRDRIEDDYLPASIAKIFRLAARFIPTEIIANSAATLNTLHLPNRLRGNTVYSGVELASRARVVHDGTPSRTDQYPATVVASTTKVIGMVGRITPWKGQHIFIHAASQIRSRFPHVRFQIIGGALFDEAGYEKQVHELTAKLGLNDAVEFLGFRENVPELISAMDVLVHASTTGEPFGQVIIEGMAAGKPVVATDGGGVPEIVVDGVTGFLVAMGDAAAMAGAICRLLENPEAAREMGQAGLLRVEQQFTIDQTAKRIEHIYLNLASRYSNRSLTEYFGGSPAAPRPHSLGG